jgi:uncharacterized protein YjlB
MAATEQTQLQIQASALPPNFEGDPQEFFDAMVRRMKIVSPFGGTFFVIGDTEPVSNQGPWLKGGTKWYVFDENLGRYVPQDISDSETIPFHIQDVTPSSSNPSVWLRTNTIGSVVNYVGWYFFNGSVWQPDANIVQSGPTASRPANPVELQKYYDSDIAALIWWERGLWRTVSGVPGDLKFVSYPTIAGALAANPGWQEIGTNNVDLRGRVFVSANADGTGGVENRAVGSGITSRQSGDLYGEETHILTSAEHEQHTHLVGHATLLNSDNNGQFFRVESVDTLAIPAPVPPNGFQINGDGSSDGTISGSIGTGPAGTQFITSVQLSASAAAAYTAVAEAHNNLQPSAAFWCLVKL